MSNIHRIVHHHFFPKVAAIFDEFQVHRVGLINQLACKVAELHVFRYGPALINHIAFFSFGDNTHTQLAHGFDLGKSLNTSYQFAQVLF